MLIKWYLENQARLRERESMIGEGGGLTLTLPGDCRSFRADHWRAEPTSLLLPPQASSIPATAFNSATAQNHLPFYVIACISECTHFPKSSLNLCYCMHMRERVHFLISHSNYICLYVVFHLELLAVCCQCVEVRALWIWDIQRTKWTKLSRFSEALWGNELGRYRYHRPLWTGKNYKIVDKFQSFYQFFH